MALALKSITLLRRAWLALRRRSALAVLLMAAGVCWPVTAGFDARSVSVHAIAVPAAPDAQISWRAQRDAFAGRLIRAYGVATPVAEEFAGWILEAAARQRLAPDLLASLVMAESSFRKHAVSPLGPVGPAQIRADLWGAFCGGDLRDAEQNVYCGAQILAHLQAVCARATAGDALDCALRSYNVGYGNRNRPYFVEAGDRYTAKIHRYLGRLSRQPAQAAQAT